MKINISANETTAVTTKSPRLEFEFEDTTTGTVTYNFSGLAHLHTIIMEVDDFTNVVTAEFKILNDNSDELYASGEKTKGDTYLITLDRILAESNGTLQVQLSGAAGGTGGSVYITIYCEL